MVRDLSEHHSPLDAPLPPRPDEDGFRRHALDDARLEQFRSQGFVTGLRVLDDAGVARLRSELEDLAREDHPGHGLFYRRHPGATADPQTTLFHALGAWVPPAFHDLLWNPAILVPAYQLLGGPVRFWHDQLFCKPAGSGGVVAWHQDYSYWTRTRPLAHLSCWVGLDDSDESSGCVHYVPGSHRWDLLPVTGLAGDMEAIQDVLTPEQRAAFRPVPVRLRAGEASFHHALTVHGSFANRSPRPRRAAVVNLVRDGVVSATDAPLLDGVPPIPRVRKVAGRFFPLLYPPG